MSRQLDAAVARFATAFEKAERLKTEMNAATVALDKAHTLFKEANDEAANESAALLQAALLYAAENLNQDARE